MGTRSKTVAKTGKRRYWMPARHHPRRCRTALDSVLISNMNNTEAILSAEIAEEAAAAMSSIYKALAMRLP